MRIPAIAVAALLAASPAAAQEQQAGNAASTNAEATFQKLAEQCDDVDALMLRARIRLLLGRTTPKAAEQAGATMDRGLAKCGEGDLEGAKATLEEAYAIADKGVTEKFGQDATPVVTANAPAEKAAQAAAEAKEDSPWWKFW